MMWCLCVISMKIRFKQKFNIYKDAAEYKKLKLLIEAKISNSILDKTILSKLLEVEGFDITVLDYSWAKENPDVIWELVQYHQFYGSLYCSYKLRSLFNKIKTESNIKSRSDVINYLKSHMETEGGGVLSNVSKFMAPNYYEGDKILLEFIALKLDFQKKYDIAREIRKNKLYHFNDYIFSNRIAGRRVAVIGPLFDIKDVDAKAELFEFDYVVALNLNVNQLETSGIKFNASYYSIRHKLTDQAEIAELSHHLECISFYWQEGIDMLIDNNKLSDSCLIRLMHNPSGVVRNDDVPNMLQNVLYDIAFMSPSAIKIYGFNAYLSEKVYSENYETTEGERWAQFGMRIHDPISNFAFVSNFVKAGILSVDDHGKVFHMQIEDYLKKLDILCKDKTLDMWASI